MSRLVRLASLLFACSLATGVLAQSADVSVTMTMPATSIYSSNDEAASVNGQFAVKNSGPSIAQNVTIDFGPYVSATSDLPGFSCGLTNGRYLCTTVSMVPGAVSGTFLVKWPQAQNGTVETTTVQVSSTSPADPDTTNNGVSGNTTVLWQADLQLTGVDVRTPVAPDSSIRVVANYANHGPSPASDFKLTLTIPPGAEAYSYYADEWLTCTPPPRVPGQGYVGDIVCTASNLFAASGFVEADVQVYGVGGYPPVPGTVFTFPVTMTSTTAITPSQTKSGSLTVVAPANQLVQMSAPASAPAGGTFESTITVFNGPAAALNTMIQYSTLQGVGVAGQMHGPAGWTCGEGYCKTDTFATGTATFTVDTFIPVDTIGTITGKVTVSSDSDSNTYDNIATASTAVIPPPKATLNLTLSGSPDLVHSGDQLTYIAQIANTSNADALSVSLLWTLPAGNTVVATTCGTTDNPQCTFATIAAGATQTVTRTIHVDAAPGTLLTASASVNAFNVDLQSNSASVSTTVVTPHVDLVPVITAPSQIRAGDSAEWIYSIDNKGPDTVTDWQLTIPLPANTTLTSFNTAAYGTCSGLTLNAVNSQVICHGTSIPFELQLVLTVTPGTTTQILATASVSTANVDTNPQNDDVAVNTMIYTLADLSASITADKTAAVTGERVTQTFTVTNDGPDAGTGVVVDISLPSSSIAAINATFASCSGTAPIRCFAPSLAPGDELKATIEFLAPAKVGLYETEAHLVWDNGFTGSTLADIGLQVIAPPPGSDVTIAVDATPVAVQQGDAVTYTLATTNVGASSASDVMVHFTLPSALTFLSASPQCTGTSAITCAAGTVSSGSSSTFAVKARAVGAGSITTTATVSTSSSDANNGNNSGSATIVVNTPPAPARRRAARH